MNANSPSDPRPAATDDDGPRRHRPAATDDDGPGRHRPPASRWWRHAARGVGGGLVSLLAVAVSGFFLFRMLPGDPARSLTRGRPVSADQLAHLRREFGTDAPLTVQFGSYLGRLLRGDLGTSYQYRRPVAEIILAHAGPTVGLVGTATVIALALGMWLGVAGAWRRGGPLDRVSTGAALVLWSMPPFWLGLMLITVFSGGRPPFGRLFPAGGIDTPGVNGVVRVLLDEVWHGTLPCLTLVAVTYAQYLLVMRAAMLDQLGADYLTTARAKGLRAAIVRRRHALPNARLPAITLVFLGLGGVISGSVLVETVFSWPGLGLLFYEALNALDLPLLEGLFIVFSAAVVAMNVLADLLYPLLDPRLLAQ